MSDAKQLFIDDVMAMAISLRRATTEDEFMDRGNALDAFLQERIGEPISEKKECIPAKHPSDNYTFEIKYIPFYRLDGGRKE